MGYDQCCADSVGKILRARTGRLGLEVHSGRLGPKVFPGQTDLSSKFDSVSKFSRAGPEISNTRYIGYDFYMNWGLNILEFFNLGVL